jgi:hypothetical protein
MPTIHVVPGSNFDWLVIDATGRELSRHRRRKSAEKIGLQEAARRGTKLFVFNHRNELERSSRPRRGLFGKVRTMPIITSEVHSINECEKHGARLSPVHKGR